MALMNVVMTLLVTILRLSNHTTDGLVMPSADTAYRAAGGSGKGHNTGTLNSGWDSNVGLKIVTGSPDFE